MIFTRLFRVIILTSLHLLLTIVTQFNFYVTHIDLHNHIFHNYFLVKSDMHFVYYIMNEIYSKIMVLISSIMGIKYAFSGITQKQNEGGGKHFGSNLAGAR